MTWRDCDTTAIRATAQAGDVMELRRGRATSEREREREKEKEVDMQWLQDTSARQRRYGQSEYPDKAAVDSRIRAK